MELDRAKLQAITNSTGTAIVTMLSLALRERDARDGLINLQTTKDKLIKMGEKVVDEEYNKFWKDLETAGIGNIVIGRRGNPDRFRWNYSVKEVARVAVEGKEGDLKALEAKETPKARVVRKRGPGRPKGHSPKKALVKASGKKRQRLSPEAKEIERTIIQKVRAALSSL